MPLIRCAGRVSSRSASSDQRALTRANRDRVSETAKTGRSGGFGPFDGKTCTVDTDFGRKRLPGPASIAICSLGVPQGVRSPSKRVRPTQHPKVEVGFAVLGGVPVRGTHGSATSGPTQAFDPILSAWYAREPGRLSRGHQHGPVCTSRQADAHRGWLRSTLAAHYLGDRLVRPGSRSAQPFDRFLRYPTRCGSG